MEKVSEGTSRTSDVITRQASNSRQGDENKRLDDGRVEWCSAGNVQSKVGDQTGRVKDHKARCVFFFFDFFFFGISEKDVTKAKLLLSASPSVLNVVCREARVR